MIAIQVTVVVAVGLLLSLIAGTIPALAALQNLDGIPVTVPWPVTVTMLSGFVLIGLSTPWTVSRSLKPSDRV